MSPYKQHSTVMGLVSEFLRHAASGFVVLFGMWLVDSASLNWIKSSIGMEHWPFLVLGPVVGFALYAIHRSTLGRIPYVILLWRKGGLTELDFARWELRHSSDPKVAAVIRELDQWTALVDYLYTSAWALAVAPLLLQVMGRPPQVDRLPNLFLSAGVLLGIALIGDLQVIRKEILFVAKTCPPPAG